MNIIINTVRAKHGRDIISISRIINVIIVIVMILLSLLLLRDTCSSYVRGGTEIGGIPFGSGCGPLQIVDVKNIIDGKNTTTDGNTRPRRTRKTHR